MATKISELAQSDFQKYFEVRLAGQKMRHGTGSGYTGLCPFHPDSNASLSVNYAKGVWKCHAGCGEGGLIDFEQKLDPNCDKATAIARIADIVGQSQLKLGGTGPEAEYTYTDPTGKELFQVVRYPGKKFMQRRRDERGGWIYRTSDIKMVPYHLDEIITAKEIFVTEGEKDADNLRAVLKNRGITGVAVTTSPRGAGKWQETFAPYFSGKKIVILPDQDEPGVKHGKQIANSVYRYAYGVKMVHIPDAKDVSDFLKAGHSIDEVITLIKEAPLWQPEQSKGILANYPPFELAAPPTVDWLVEGLMERGSNGMIVAPPKSAKSFLTLYMAFCLATGRYFFDYKVPRRVRTAYFSREDNPSQTGQRARRIRQGMQIELEELNDWLSINTRQQSPRLLLDNEEDITQVISDLKAKQVEVAIFDVLRVLHVAKENDNTEMQVVIEKFNRIRDEAGVTIMLLHHARKSSEGATITEMARGAGAIGGWAELLIHVHEIDKPTRTRKFEAQLKGADSPEPFQWRINDYPPTEIGGEYYVKLELVPFDQRINETSQGSSNKPEFDGGPAYRRRRSG